MWSSLFPNPAPLTRVEALLWASHLLHTESDAIYYAYPPPTEAEKQHANSLQDIADQMYEDAMKLAGLYPMTLRNEKQRGELWRRALVRFQGDL